MAKEYDAIHCCYVNLVESETIVDVLDLSSALRIIRHVKRVPGDARYARVVEKCLFVTGHNHEDAVEIRKLCVEL